MPAAEWHDLDNIIEFNSCLESLTVDQVRNFAVRFNTGHAHCALNVNQHDIESLFQTEKDQEQERETRWLNFWAGEVDSDGIASIVKRYGISSRLAALLYTQSKSPKASSSPAEPKRRKDVDVEKGAVRSELSSKPAMASSQPPGFGDIVDSLWHFCSIDRGPKYLHVGFNSLFTAPDVSVKQDMDLSRPSGLRIWTSLLLFYDGTVVSIYEKPPSGTPREYIQAMRRNVLNNLRHLSQLGPSTSSNSVMHVTVRPNPSSEQMSTLDSESPALLFYYLFDDWTTTYALITQRHNPYRDQLETIREMMFETADVNIVKSLDLVGRRLTTLRLMYQSYELTIRQILKHGSNFRRRRRSWDSDDDMLRTDSHILPEHSGVTLPVCAVSRFERLLDRIRLYALTELEECLKQKESLVFMNFNLIALKESQAVERLTRTTILLAKVTILFLPVSLMTGYFSVQISGVENVYNLKTYWACFAIVLAISMLVLVGFGRMAHQAEGKTTYKSMTRTFWDRALLAKAKRH